MISVRSHSRVTPSRAATGLGFALVTLFLFLPIKTPFNAYDEGFAVFNASRILHGDAPYRDFWTIYPPGQFYSLALIFEVFGASLLAARFYDTVVRLLIVLGVYALAAGVTSRAWALLASLATALLLGAAGAFGYAVFPSLALCVFSVNCVLRYSRSGRRSWLLLCGALLGLSSLFRWDIALYAATGTVAGVALHGRARTREAASVLGLMAAIALPLYAAIGFRAGLGNLFGQVVVFPATVLRDVRSLPVPAALPPVFAPTDLASLKSLYHDLLHWSRFYLPIGVYVGAVAHYGYWRRKGRAWRDARYQVCTTTLVFGALLCVHAWSRYDFIHVAPTSILALLLAAFLGHDLFATLRVPMRRLLRFAVGLLLLFYFLAPVRDLLRGVMAYPASGCFSGLERAGCVAVPPDQEQAIQYVRRVTAADEPIFVGTRRHDLIFTNDIGFYFLAERPSATRYHELSPGVATTLPVQQAIVQDIDERVNWVVLGDSPPANEPNASAVSSGVHFLDDFLQSRFAAMAQFGRYEIRRKVEPPGE